jgi:hypothetical protein
VLSKTVDMIATHVMRWKKPRIREGLGHTVLEVSDTRGLGGLGDKSRMSRTRVFGNRWSSSENISESVIRPSKSLGSVYEVDP